MVAGAGGPSGGAHDSAHISDNKLFPLKPSGGGVPGQNCAATVFHVWSQKPATLLQSFPPHDSTLASTWSILGGALGGDALGGGASGGGRAGGGASGSGAFGGGVSGGVGEGEGGGASGDDTFARR